MEHYFKSELASFRCKTIVRAP